MFQRTTFYKKKFTISLEESKKGNNWFEIWQKNMITFTIK